jgi:leucyl-tRNA---protein transferase
MTYYNIHHPTAMPGHLLDEYLAKGWYRMQQTIFTTDIITQKELLIPVFWIRLLLDKYVTTKISRKIIDRNKDCIITITKGSITPEAEALYQLYKASINFDVSETIHDYLIGENNFNIYNTFCIEIRHQLELIAVGFFDEGDNSIAGILNFFHPAFKNRSLGKYLMLLKIEYALRQGKKFYYPGYLSTAITKFDYKLFPGKEATEVYIATKKQWVPWLSITAAQLESLLFANESEE